MTTISQPKRHASELFHRRHSQRIARPENPQGHTRTTLFEGTDTVAQNRKVAVQRIVEVHDALELQHHTESATSDRPGSSSSLSSDPFTIDFSAIPFPDAEIRAFRYFLRMWDPSSTPDPDFDDAINPSKREFEDAALKHFFRRIAFWHESEELLKATKDRMSKDAKKREKEKENSALGKLWMVEKERQEHSLRDELKEATTREGLAQLLWTLLHDQHAPLAPELFEECRDAVKKKYGIKS